MLSEGTGLRAVGRSQFRGTLSAKARGATYSQGREELVEGFQPGSDIVKLSLVALRKMDFGGMRPNYSDLKLVRTRICSLMLCLYGNSKK